MKSKRVDTKAFASNFVAQSFDINSSSHRRANKGAKIHKKGAAQKSIRERNLSQKNWSSITWCLMMAKTGLYANIHAKRKRIAAGSGEDEKAWCEGAPTAITLACC